MGDSQTVVRSLACGAGAGGTTPPRQAAATSGCVPRYARGARASPPPVGAAVIVARALVSILPRLLRT